MWGDTRSNAATPSLVPGADQRGGRKPPGMSGHYPREAGRRGPEAEADSSTREVGDVVHGERGAEPCGAGAGDLGGTDPGSAAAQSGELQGHRGERARAGARLPAAEGSQ